MDHIFGRNASSPPAAQSCNGGRRPNVVVYDSISFAGTMLGLDNEDVPFVVNNPTGVYDFDQDPLWFPSIVVAADILNLSPYQLWVNLKNSLTYAQNPLASPRSSDSSFLCPALSRRFSVPLSAS